MIRHEEKKVYDFFCDECNEELSEGSEIFCRKCWDNANNDKIVSEFEKYLKEENRMLKEQIKDLLEKIDIKSYIESTLKP